MCLSTSPRNLVTFNQTNWSLIFLLAVALTGVFPVFISDESVHMGVTSFVSDLSSVVELEWGCMFCFIGFFPYTQVVSGILRSRCLFPGNSLIISNNYF